MKHLYAPWRDKYFTEKVDGCVFCKMVENTDKDEELNILFRDKRCFGVMNRYPYSPGHFMIIPNSHKDALENLDEQTWLEMSIHVKNSVKLLKDVLGAGGVNIGMNLGKNAGAGIAEHIHYHLVPRWERDTNFITTIGQARVYGSDLDTIYKHIKSAIPKFLELKG